MDGLYDEYWMKVDQADLKHTGIVVAAITQELKDIGLNGLELELDSEKGVLFVGVYPDIIQQQLAGGPTGRPRLKIDVDRDTIREMVDQYGANQAAAMLGISRRTLFRRLKG